CREARVISVAWLFEAIQPALVWDDALALERSAGGGRCTIVPFIVSGRLTGAVVAGPSGQTLSATTITQLAARVEAAAEELARALPGASTSGAPLTDRDRVQQQRLATGVPAGGDRIVGHLVQMVIALAPARHRQHHQREEQHATQGVADPALVRLGGQLAQVGEVLLAVAQAVEGR